MKSFCGTGRTVFIPGSVSEVYSY